MKDKYIWNIIIKGKSIIIYLIVIDTNGLLFIYFPNFYDQIIKNSTN
jgi:hypothetical protein